MKLLFLTTADLQTGGNTVRIKVETDGTTLYVKAGRFPRSTSSYGGVYLEITYNGEAKAMSSSPFSDMQVSFPYSDSVKQITVSGGELYYDGVEYGESITFAWKGNYSDPTPSVNVSFNGIRYESQFTLSFSYNNKGSYYIYPIAVYANTWHTENKKWYRLTYLSAKSTSSSLSKSLSSTQNNRSKIEFYIYFAMYKKSTDAEDDYIGICEYVTPVYTITNRGTPYAPHGLYYDDVEAGIREEVSWTRVADSSFSTVEYQLQRSIDGADYVDIYEGEDDYYYDRVPEKTRTVSYRVRAVSDDKVSAWCEGDEKNLVKCNAYVGVNGVIRSGMAVYIGVNGQPKETQGEFIVG